MKKISKNLEKRISFVVGDERINRSGRPKGSRNRSTLVREWLAVEQKTANLITGDIEVLDQSDQMTLALILKAKEGDVQAYKELIQYLPDDNDNKSDTEIVIRRV